MDIKSYYPVIIEQDRLLPFYVATIGITRNDRKVYRPYGIEDYQLIYCEKGEGMVLIQGEEKKVTAGMGFFLPPNTVHSYYAIQEPWETHWLTFHGSAAEQVVDFGACAFKITHMELLGSLFEEILALPRDSRWGEDSSVKLYKLLLELKKCVATDTLSSVYDLQSQLKDVMDYIKRNYCKPVELEILAELARITPSHLCRLFRAAYNCRPFEYITALRLQKSKELLLSRRHMSVSRISEAVGYNSASYYTLLFKKQEKITPGEFRARHLQEG